MLRGIDYGTGEEVYIPDWIERLIHWLLEILSLEIGGKNEK